MESTVLIFSYKFLTWNFLKNRFWQKKWFCKNSYITWQLSSHTTMYSQIFTILNHRFLTWNFLNNTFGKIATKIPHILAIFVFLQCEQHFLAKKPRFSKILRWLAIIITSYNVKSLTFSVTKILLLIEILCTALSGESTFDFFCSSVLLELRDISWIVCAANSGFTDWLRFRIMLWWTESATDDHELLRIGFLLRRLGTANIEHGCMTYLKLQFLNCI